MDARALSRRDASVARRPSIRGGACLSAKDPRRRSGTTRRDRPLRTVTDLSLGEAIPGTDRRVTQGGSMHRFGREYDRVARERLMPRAREMRLVPTRSEELLWQAIRANALGVRFRRQVILGPVIVDFFAPSAMLVVEVDGGVHERTRRRSLSRRVARAPRDPRATRRRAARGATHRRCCFARASRPRPLGAVRWRSYVNDILRKRPFRPGESDALARTSLIMNRCP